MRKNFTRSILFLFLGLIALNFSVYSQVSAEKGSKIAKDGFKNETVIRDKFNDWQNDKDAKDWLELMGFNAENIESVQAFKVSGKKSDIRVKVKTKSGEFEQGISIKLVSSPRGFNQIDKRWVSDYASMWNMADDVATALKYFVGEIKSDRTDLRSEKRMYLNEMNKEIQDKTLKFFAENKEMIVSDLLKGRGELAADWLLVAQKKSGGKNRWNFTRIDDAIKFFSEGEVQMTRYGNLKIGQISMQRKGGDRGRKTAQMLQFKMNPAALFDQ